NFNHLRFDQLCVARQREANSTALQPRVKLFFLTAVDSDKLDRLPRRPHSIKPCNSLNYKAFSFPSAPEVGRIIDTSTSASTVIFKSDEISGSQDYSYIETAKTRPIYI
ncbi:hypothetical protein, partial [Pseudomonas viridiflava]|uniref:hypothetical protein n=1 Tax=Pseudomonas viridiflava TaxID=33069 RepID=UPI003BB8020A